MSNWQQSYEKKLMKFEDFPDLLKDGDEWCNAMGTTAASKEFADAVIDQYERFHDVRFSDEVQVKPLPFHDPETIEKLRGHINTHAWYWLTAWSKLAASNLSDYSSISTEDCTDCISKVTNVFTFMCCPPNEQGWMNLGLNNFFTKDLITRGRETGALREVVAEVNDQMPVVFGDNWIHVSQVDHVVEHSSKIAVFGTPVPDETEKVIGDYALELIRDGDCIQMGIGSLTQPVIERLDNFHDLGINSEMIPMGLNHLAEVGAVTNLNKKIHKGISTATLIMGDQPLYDYCTENPSVNLFCCDYINHPTTIFQNPQQVAINQCLMVDFTGQSTAEAVGNRQISGPGGQLDFSMGAHWSKGGRSMVLMRSAHTDKNGNLHSNIVPELPGGTAVTVPRAFADYVVTEYGIASLRGKSRRGRVKELISVAHPDLRKDLEKQALAAYWPEAHRSDADFQYSWSPKQYEG